MDGTHPLSIARQQLADAIAHYQPPTCSPLNVSPWIAMSALQKAIRRGSEKVAQRAAATLLSLSPDRLWRRCGGIAFEDIGVGDLDTVALVTAALAGTRFRAEIGGDWAVAAFVIERMAQAPKCRTADDLLMAANLHPSLATVRSTYAQLTTPGLLEFATGPGPILDRAIALWFAVGTNRYTTRHLPPRQGEPRLVFDHLAKTGVPNSVVEIARRRFSKGAGMLAPFVALLHVLRQTESVAITDDELPPETMIGDVPSWAYDMYSREGRRALDTFLEGGTETARWVRAHIPPRQWVNFLGGIVFRIEGGAVRSRLRWPTADELRYLVDVECNGSRCPDATAILQLVRADLPGLNEVRSHVC